MPGADLTRMPIGLDFKAVSVAEGLRAAVATGVVLVINIWVQSPSLTLAAFAANLTCFCDSGGPVRARIPALLTFTVLGASIWSFLGLIHGLGWPLLVGLSGVIVFCNSIARVWGMRAQQVGAVLTVVLALAIDQPLSGPEASALFLAFMVGGAWALLLTIGIWRIHPNRPVARVVAWNWRLLAELTRDLTDLTGSGETDPVLWEAHAREHRRAVRAALEESRMLLLASVRSPGPVSPDSARAMLALEAAEQIFGALIAFSDILEAVSEAATREVGLRILRRLRPCLGLLGQEIPGVSERVELSLDRMTSEATEAPALTGVAGVLIDRLRLSFGLKREQGLPDFLRPSPTRPSPFKTALQQLRGALTWDSAILRHATRAAVLTMAAVAVSLAWPSPYAHWLTITVALTMQPYFAATWQRAVERIGGTVLGAMLGGALAFAPSSPLSHALLLVPLSIIGFSVRQVSYGAYIACLTPLVVLLFEVAEPGHSEWAIAAWRTLYTIGGGALAVLACMVLWPSWEPERTEGELKVALKAHADYAAAVFALMSETEHAAALDEARRKAGLASNNLEASLSRALQEPKTRRSHRLESLMAADAALRRLGAGFVTLRYDPAARLGVDDAAWAAWRIWVPAALTDLSADGLSKLGRMPEAPATSTLARLGRAIELLRELLSPRQARNAEP